MASGKIERKTHFEEMTDFDGFPFTAPSDGFITVIAAPGSSSASYLYITDNGFVCSRAAYVGGQNYSQSFPAIKGHIYAISASSNVNTGGSYFHFYPLS